jgi:hypothetical protein
LAIARDDKPFRVNEKARFVRGIVAQQNKGAVRCHPLSPRGRF